MMQLRAPVLATQRIARHALLHPCVARIAPPNAAASLQMHPSATAAPFQRIVMCTAAEAPIQGRHMRDLHPASSPAHSGEAEAAVLPDIVKMDIRVGKILSCEKHPDADRYSEHARLQHMR